MEDAMQAIARVARLLKGGTGSGNYGHAGRPGEVGGSAPGDAAPSVEHEHTGISESRLKAETFSPGMIAKAKSIEPRCTADMLKVADACQKASMMGLEFRLKGQKSLADKLEESMTQAQTTDIASVANQMNDLVRYTLQSDPETYTENYDKMLKSLTDMGYSVARVRNYWDGTGYKGVNVVLREPEGHRVELQFHTKQSRDVKENESHKLYEELRVCHDKDEQARLNGEIAKVWAPVAAPKDTGTIQSFEDKHVEFKPWIPGA